MTGEFDLIKRHLLGAGNRRPGRIDGYPSGTSPGSGVLLHAGDDAALLEPSPEKGVSVSVDTSRVNVHFPADAPAHAIGYRALAVSLSDLAAMGARPRWCLMALTLDRADDLWLEQFSEGFHSLARKNGITLVGGDVTRGELAISVTVMGENDPIATLRRDTAKAGDLIVVTGPLGNAAGGLTQWQAGQRNIDDNLLLQSYLYPQPRVAAGQALIGMASAAMDISDGLLADLTHMCRASGLNAELDTESLPISTALLDAVGESASRALALNGGDDYELLFTLPEQLKDYVEQVLANCGASLNVIGRMKAASDSSIPSHDATTPVIFTPQGEPLVARGWDHFDESELLT